jgi:hypothetical protein
VPDPTAWSTAEGSQYFLQGLVPPSAGIEITPDGRTALAISDGSGSSASVVRLIVEDVDADQVDDGFDNCPAVSNPTQADRDRNGIGDVCNEGEDQDGDDWSNPLDNCPEDSNTLQEDRDDDGIGDLSRCSCPEVFSTSPIPKCHPTAPFPRFSPRPHPTNRDHPPDVAHLSPRDLSRNVGAL